METHRAQGASSRISGLACLTAVLLGIAMLSQPNLANAADNTALSVMRGSGSDQSDLSQVPAGGSLVLRGTRPPSPNASEPSPGVGGGGYVVPNNTFQPGPLYGPGWDRRFDYSGLSSPGSPGSGW